MGAVPPRLANHIPALDGLRGLAILVVIPHNADRFGWTHDWTRWPAMAAHAGWIGVQLFFVLSGFLITRNLLDTLGRPHYLRSFYARRVLRIFPLYYGSLVFFLLLLPKIVTLPPAILDSYRYQPWLWAFLSNATGDPGRSVYWFTHFWSLAIEEQFYLVWPFVVAVAGPRSLGRVALVVAGIAIGVRAALLAAGTSPGEIYEATACRMDALAIGALAALLLRSAPGLAFVRRHGSAILAGAALAFAIGAFATGLYRTTDAVLIVAGYTVLALAAAALLIVSAAGGGGAVADGVRRVLETRPLRSVGRYSYGMYVLHLPIALALGASVPSRLAGLGPAAPLGFVLVVAVASYAGAALSYHLLEKHFLALKRHCTA